VKGRIFKKLILGLLYFLPATVYYINNLVQARPQGPSADALGAKPGRSLGSGGAGAGAGGSARETLAREGV
jgi:hypothetical protein